VTYSQFLKNLNARGMFRIRPGLDRVSRVLAALGSPQDSWPSLHIAGTNGKGSVAAGLECVLRACGYRTGLYTSPHLVDLRERIQINGEPANSEIGGLASDVIQAEKATKTRLTHFEFLTAVAFLAFARQKIEVGIVECGMGGLWDATNTMSHPLVSVITSVGLDHREWLGDNERAIASQKAGIIKTRGYVVSGVRGIGQESIIRAARDKDATLVQWGQDFTSEHLTSSWRSGTQTLRYQFKGDDSEIIPFGLLGSHQSDNAALILTALRHLKMAGWSVPSSKRDQALKEIDWPGRLQVISRPAAPTLLLDGAHNPAALKKTLEAMESSIFRNTPKTFVFSAFKDKDFGLMAKMIQPMAGHISLCRLAGPRGATLTQLRSAFRGSRNSVREYSTARMALVRAMRETPTNGLVVVTGSFALVGEALKLLKSAPLGFESTRELQNA
jgi:dihydrofolate synthase/folylpolyglutamate synthase